jgi:hypothetical protein
MLVAHNKAHDTPNNMDQQEPPEFILDVFTDPRSVRDVVKGQLLSPDRHPTLDKPPRYPRDSFSSALRNKTDLS